LIACDEIANPNLHQIATAQFAVDGQVEQRAVTNAMMLIEEEAYCPDLTWLE
jgi:hypothetical protein